MKSFEQDLTARLREIRSQDLHRELRSVDSPQGTHLRVGGNSLINFSSNDYLGLASEPALKEAAIRAVEQFGTGSGASRLICGSLAPHHQLEETLAAFKGTEAALSFSSGYAAAVGTISALIGKGDIIILDKLVHASIVDAARLAGAVLRVFAHNDLNDLESILQWTVKRHPGTGAADSAARPRVLIVTESLFSMDGDHAPLRALVDLKERFGAWLMLDEAHATGLFGARRRGLAEECGVSNQVEIQMATLGKAVGASGGCICGSRRLIDFLINRARSFVFSTAPPPAAAAAASAGIQFIQSNAGEERRRQLWQRASELRSLLPPADSESPSPIIPVIVGDEADAMAAARALLDEGFFIPAIRYPSVARRTARLRITVTAGHSTAEIAQLAAAVSHALKKPA